LGSVEDLYAFGRSPRLVRGEHRTERRSDHVERAVCERQLLWLLLCRPRPEVCISPPGADEHVVVRTDVATLVDVQRGHLPLAKALARGVLALDGDPVLRRAVPRLGRDHTNCDDALTGPNPHVTTRASIAQPSWTESELNRRCAVQAQLLIVRGRL
jgi:hypothetical protein